MSQRFASSGWLLVISMAAAAAAALLATHDLTPAGHPASVKVAAATAITKEPPIAQLAPIASVAMPPALAGTDIPLLPIDNRGHLQPSRHVREFFDYYLTARHQVAPVTLDLMVKDSIAHQLSGHPAAGEAIALWQRYRAYLAAVADLPASTSPSLAGTPDLDALGAAFDARMRLADRYLGEGGWNQVFFGDDWQTERNDLERLRLQADPNLSAADKAARLASLDAGLPADEQARREQSRRQEQAIQHALALQAQGAAPADVGASVIADEGTDAAARVTAMAQTQQAWQTRYAAYAQARDQVMQQTMPAADQAVLLDRLRQQFFSTTADVTRAAAFDRASLRR